VHVLVVCTANIARSPLAEAMLAASIGPLGVRVGSAGVAARWGLPAAERSQQLAEARGLDLSAHRSQPVTEELIRSSALVLTMSERHRDRCAPLVAGAGAHVFTVRELVRLLEVVDLDRAPAAVTDRLPWVVEQAHLARPTARPARGREDIYDPIRDPEPAWLEMGATLDRTIGAIVENLGAAPGWEVQDPSDPGPTPLSGPDYRRGARRPRRFGRRRRERNAG
jgi:protein-tyrosine phosphatase